MHCVRGIRLSVPGQGASRRIIDDGVSHRHDTRPGARWHAPRIRGRDTVRDAFWLACDLPGASRKGPSSLAVTTGNTHKPQSPNRCTGDGEQRGARGRNPGSGNRPSWRGTHGHAHYRCYEPSPLRHGERRDDAARFRRRNCSDPGTPSGMLPRSGEGPLRARSVGLGMRSSAGRLERPSARPRR